MHRLTIATKKRKEVIDITEPINQIIARNKAESGLCNVFVAHTTASVSVADLDPGTDLDLLDFLEELQPKLKYRHPHDPTHVGDHILSTIIGSSVTIPYEMGHLILGIWQRVVLIELDGPRERLIIVTPI